MGTRLATDISVCILTRSLISGRVYTSCDLSSVQLVFTALVVQSSIITTYFAMPQVKMITLQVQMFLQPVYLCPHVIPGSFGEVKVCYAI